MKKLRLGFAHPLLLVFLLIAGLLTFTAAANLLGNRVSFINNAASVNLLINEGFESGTTAWKGISGTQTLIVSSPVHSGSSALQIGLKRSGSKTVSQFVSVTENTQYFAGTWLNSQAINQSTATLNIVWLRTITTSPKSSDIISQSTIFTTGVPASWQNFTGTVTSPTGAVSAKFSLTLNLSGSVNSVVYFDDNSFGPTAIISQSPTPTPTPTSTITMGETNILSSDDSGNGNLLVVQQSSLAQTATIQSLSFYVTAAAGNLRLGIYSDSGGKPQTLLAQTAEFTPILGWNTQNVVTPVQITAGNYWLAYLPQSNNLHFALSNTGSAYYYTYTYGPMPAIYSSSATPGTYHWSFYATLNTGTPTVTPTPTPTPSVTPTPTPPSGAFVYPLKMSANKRYLVDQNNAPFLMSGDSPQAIVAKVSLTDAGTFFADRKSKNINTVWINLVCSSDQTCNADGSTYDGIAPFTTTGDLSTPNNSYFTRVDQMIQLAANNGINVVLDPIETAGWLSVLQSNGTTKAFNYGVYLGNRYKNFPNIIWMSGNDFQTWATASDDALVSAVANGIKSVDPNHIQTVELNYDDSGSLDDPTWASIINLDTAYTYYPTYNRVLTEYNRTAFMPVFFVEGVYEWQTYGLGYLGPYELRNQEYWSLLSGAEGQIYGNNNIWPFPAGWQTMTYADGKNWTNSTGITQFVYANNFFASRQWYNLVPDQYHTVATAGYGTYLACCRQANSNYVTTARSTDGSLVISYIPTNSSGALTINMSQLSGLVTARWFDPTTGTYTTITGSPFANTGSRQFTPPAGKHSDGTNDWVLVLQTP